MRHLTCPEGTEISGEGILSLTQNLLAEEINPLLEKHGLVDLQADQWYPCQPFIDVLNDIKEDFYLSMVAIGMAVGQNTSLPPGIEISLDDILMGMNDHYHMHHRHAEIGRFETEKLGEGNYRLTFDSIYPDDLEYGVSYGFAQRLLPPGTRFVVKYDPDVLRKDEGGTQTAYFVRWGEGLNGAAK